MPPTVEKSSAPVLVDNPQAPEMFAAEAVGFFLLNGVVMITFATAHVDHTGGAIPLSRVVNARMVMPIVGAQALAAGLYDFLKTRGLDPVPKKAEDVVQ